MKVITLKEKQELQFKLDKLQVLNSAIQKFEIVTTDIDLNYLNNMIDYAIHGATSIFKNEFNENFYPFKHSDAAVNKQPEYQSSLKHADAANSINKV